VRRGINGSVKMPTIFDILHEEHEQVSKLLKQIGSEKDTGKRETLIKEVHQDLSLHMRFEEDEVYPAIQKATGDEASIKDAAQEHHQAMHLLKTLAKSVDMGDSDWKEQLKNLETAIKHHVSDEENKLFPKAREKVSKTQTE
jgi:iron-sulfur cluster repair protein YtfE (RIC family)